MRIVHGILVCLLALMMLPVVFARDDSQDRVKAIVQELKSHPPNANDAQTAKAVAHLKELGELGPDAASAVPYPRSHYKGDARVDFAAVKGLTEKDGWIFADNRDAYAAVRIVKGGYHWNESGTVFGSRK